MTIITRIRHVRRTRFCRTIPVRNDATASYSEFVRRGRRPCRADFGGTPTPRAAGRFPETDAGDSRDTRHEDERRSTVLNAPKCMRARDSKSSSIDNRNDCGGKFFLEIIDNCGGTFFGKLILRKKAAVALKRGILSRFIYLFK